MSRLDPKPGRWILPLVVIGLIAFTWVFVDRLPPTSDDAPTTSATTSAPAPADTTTTRAPADTTTTTSTIPPEVAAFLTAADLIGDEAARLLTEAEAINAAWEDGGTFTRALNDLQDLAETTAAFTQSISDTSVPESLAEGWVPVEEAAAGMATAADEMVVGLRSTDTGQIRRAALADFGTAVASLTLAVNDAKTAAEG
jgi:hypothetical protein